MVASPSRPSAVSINAVLPMRADDVDVSAGVHEYGGDVGVVAGGGDHESRVARSVGRVDVGTMGKQPGHEGCVSRGGGAQQVVGDGGSGGVAL